MSDLLTPERMRRRHLDDTPDTLLSRADAVMSVAKNAGKNRVAFLRDGQWVVRSGKATPPPPSHSPA